mmetsp:Transcript_2154/g.2850  ORF Transcript_2154/g.2850 Transcript_2154/m.2850 type:complete len:87 (-) Transcript_2154:156-416(-)
MLATSEFYAFATRIGKRQQIHIFCNWMGADCCQLDMKLYCVEPTSSKYSCLPGVWKNSYDTDIRRRRLLKNEWTSAVHRRTHISTF